MVKKRTGRSSPQEPDDGPELPAVISAQVILKAAEGHAGESATAATIGSMMPPPHLAAAVTGEFRRRGFEVGPVVGTSFSITAPPRTFEAAFDTRLPRKTDRRLDLNPSGQGYELPLAALPPDVARGVEAIVFTPPPDFGPVPGGY